MRTGRPKEYRNRTTFTISLDPELMDRFREISQRENREMNRLIQEFMKRYINEHGDGNNQFKIDKWYSENDFKATPAFLESSEKWDKYIGECDAKELARLQGQALTIAQKTKLQFLEKRKQEMFTSR